MSFEFSGISGQDFLDLEIEIRDFRARVQILAPFFLGMRIFIK